MNEDLKELQDSQVELSTALDKLLFELRSFRATLTDVNNRMEEIITDVSKLV